MKRTFGMLTGVAVLATMVYLGSRLSADNGSAAAPATQPRTRIALVNVTKVIKDYKKFVAFREEFKQQFRVYEDKIQAIKKLQEGLAREAQNPQTTPERRAQIENDNKNYTRQIQDISDEAKQKLGKQEAEQLKIIYKEVQEASQFYARARDIEMVLQYNDGFAGTPEEDNPLNIQRKLTSDACLPIYVTPGMDITDAVVHMLNDRYTRSMPQPPAGGTAPRQQ